MSPLRFDTMNILAGALMHSPGMDAPGRTRRIVATSPPDSSGQSALRASTRKLIVGADFDVLARHTDLRTHPDSRR